MPYLHSDISKVIIASAYEVHNQLGHGFLESIYHNALCYELSKRGLNCQQEFPIQVSYKGMILGNFRADILVEEVIIVELKAIEAILPVYETQLVNYLKATKIELGLLLNFGSKLEVKRRILTNDRKG